MSLHCNPRTLQRKRYGDQHVPACRGILTSLFSRSLSLAHPVVRWDRLPAVISLGRGPYVVVCERVLLSYRLLEPHMLITGVVRNQIYYQLQTCKVSNQCYNALRFVENIQSSSGVSVMKLCMNLSMAGVDHQEMNC
jgi:hypothetical protein